MKKRARASEKKKERKIDRKKGMFKCLLKKTGLEYFYNKFSFFVSSANKEHVHLMGEKLFSNFEKHNLKISSNTFLDKPEPELWLTHSSLTKSDLNNGFVEDLALL